MAIMRTKEQLQKLFVETAGPRFYCLNLPEGVNPYRDATDYVTGALFVMRADDGQYYACGDGNGDPAFTTEITE